jgi:hypothetical protein
MSTMNPLKFFGGMILEIGAVIAVLAMLPALGSRDAQYPAAASFSESQPNQVFFDARSSRVVGNVNEQPVPRAAWQSDLVSPPPVAQQRYVENTLDHNGQRALDAAARFWNRGDQLLPPDLRVRHDPAPPMNELVPSHYAPRSSPNLYRY